MQFSALSIVLPISYILVQVVTVRQFSGVWRKLALAPLIMVGLSAIGISIAAAQGSDAYVLAFAGVLPIALAYLMVLTLFRATLRGG